LQWSWICNHSFLQPFDQLVLFDFQTSEANESWSNFDWKFN
jgi:hypothetical protein